jgi:hypothetical protein
VSLLFIAHLINYAQLIKSANKCAHCWGEKVRARFSSWSNRREIENLENFEITQPSPLLYYTPDLTKAIPLGVCVRGCVSRGVANERVQHANNTYYSINKQ